MGVLNNIKPDNNVHSKNVNLFKSIDKFISMVMYLSQYNLRISKYSPKNQGFNPDFWENTILRYEVARTCTNNLRVVLSPYS